MRLILLLLTVIGVSVFAQTPTNTAPTAPTAPPDRPAVVDGLDAGQDQEPPYVDPDPPPHDPPADSPACNNYHDAGPKNCRCPKAMMEGGHHEGRPDRTRGQDWCKTYCLAGKCGCLSPKKMPMDRKQVSANGPPQHLPL